MSDWIDEIRNQSEFFISHSATIKPNYENTYLLEQYVAKEFHEINSFDFSQKQHKYNGDKKMNVAKRALENFCDDQYRFYLSRLKDCEGRMWYSESFDHSHNSNEPNVHTDLAYCYNRGLFFAENEKNNDSIFAVLPVFNNENYHFTFFGTTRTLLSNDNGDSHYAYIGFVRNGCKSHVFHEFFPEDSVVSSLPEKCPITGVKASHLFTVLSDRYSDCRDAILLMSKNDESHVASARTVNSHEDAPTR